MDSVHGFMGSGYTMGHAAVEPLPVLSLAPEHSTDALLTPLLRACHRHHGLLLLELCGTADAPALRDLHERAAEFEGDYDRVRVDTEVAASREPAAAAALHRLARKLTKAHMRRLGEHSYALHPHTDELSDWMHPGAGRPVHSRLLVSRASSLGKHIDRGLFNIVVGTAHDLSALQLSIDGGTVGLGSMLPERDPERLLALVVPGFTLQCIDPRTRAIPHSVKSTGFVGPRTTIVLQWRLSPLYQLRPGLALGPLLDQFKVSVRERAHQERQERAQQGHEAWACGAEEDIDWAPTIEPSRKYKLYIKQLTGKTLTIRAHVDWSVGNLKWKIQAVEGVPLAQQRLIFGGTELENGCTLGDCGIPKESSLHLVLRLSGD